MYLTTDFRKNLKIELNGGINTPQECIEVLKTFDGAMVGRAAYSHPLLWQTMDANIFHESPSSITASNVIKGIISKTKFDLLVEARDHKAPLSWTNETIIGATLDGCC